MIKDILKCWIPWVLGVVVVVFVLSLLENEEIDWRLIVSMSIAGLIGILMQQE